MITATIVICLLTAASTPEACNESNAARLYQQQFPTMTDCWRKGAQRALDEIDKMSDPETVFRVVCK